MDTAGNAQTKLTIEQLPELREKTERISRVLQEQLSRYLDTLRPLLAPMKVLGRYTGRGREDVAGADAAFAQVQRSYKETCGKPFSLLPELDEAPLQLIENRIELYPWEYDYEAKSEKVTKTLTICSPVRWILTFGSAQTPSQLRQTLAGQGERRLDTIRQFLVNALAMRLLFTKYPGLAELLKGLRFETRVEKCPGLGELSMISIASCLPSFRPSDDLMLAATRLSGVPAFIELIDVNAMRAMADPLKREIDEILG